MVRADFSKIYKNDWALFCQAISEMYTKYIVSPDVRVPPGCTIEDMDFLNPKTKLMYLPWGLYSAGQAAKSDESAEFKDQVTGRNKKWPVTMVGDSGGFQIETGTIKWEGKKTKERMLRWLENYCDWSMILDFPTGSLDRRGHDTFYKEFVYDDDGNPVYEEITEVKNGKTKKKKVQKEIMHPLDFWFCLDRTMENNDYFIQNRILGKTKFLNVLQGRTDASYLSYEEIVKLDYPNLDRETQKRLLLEHKISENDAWYELTKKYSKDFGERSFEGWALAGKHKDNFDLTLRRITIMLHEGLLAEKPWMHFLGMGQLGHSCIYTSIQKGVREHAYGNKEFRISHDASSAFSTAGAYSLAYYNHSLTKKGWSLRFSKLLEDNKYVGSSEPIMVEESIDPKNQGKEFYMKPLSSPAFDIMTMGDICVNLDTNGKHYHRCMDKSSYAFLMHHNAYYLQKAIVEAQKIYEMPYHRAKDLIPDDVLAVRNIVEDVLNEPNRDKALALIKKNKKTLRLMVGNGGEAEISNIENEELFEVDRKHFKKPSNKMKKTETQEAKLVLDIFE